MATLILRAAAWTAISTLLTACADKPQQPAVAVEPQAPAATSLEKAPLLPRLQDIQLRLVESDDVDVPMKAARKRRLVVDDSVDDAALRKAMIDYYLVMRAELQEARQPTRHVWMWVYPSAKRAAAGGGEWRAMLSARAFDGTPLPDEPESITIRPALTGPDAPSALEDAIYDEMKEALDAVDSAGEYRKKVLDSGRQLTKADMRKIDQLDKGDEDRVKRDIAKKHNMTIAEVESLFAKVMFARMR